MRRRRKKGGRRVTRMWYTDTVVLLLLLLLFLLFLLFLLLFLLFLLFLLGGSFFRLSLSILCRLHINCLTCSLVAVTISRVGF